MKYENSSDNEASINKMNDLPSFVDFNGHRARDDVTGSKILCDGSVTFHETFTFAVDEVSTFTTAAFSDQTSSSVDSCVSFREGSVKLIKYNEHIYE